MPRPSMIVRYRQHDIRLKARRGRRAIIGVKSSNT